MSAYTDTADLNAYKSMGTNTDGPSRLTKGTDTHTLLQVSSKQTDTQGIVTSRSVSTDTGYLSKLMKDEKQELKSQIIEKDSIIKDLEDERRIHQTGFINPENCANYCFKSGPFCKCYPPCFPEGQWELVGSKNNTSTQIRQCTTGLRNSWK